MPDDIWYGADCEARIGVRANATTPPTTWQGIEYMQITINPTQEWRPRNKLGAAGVRRNPLDPIRPRKGFFRLGAELVLDGDSRMLPLILRAAMGAPMSAAGPEEDLYEHVFESGQKTEHYFDLVIKVGDADFRVYQGLTLAQLSVQFSGETTQDFDVNLSLAGLSKTKKGEVTAWPAGTVTAAPAEAPILRAMFEVDGTPATNMLSGAFTFGRTLQEGVHLSATPTVSSQRPNGAQHSGSAVCRALGGAFDTLEEADQAFEAAFNLIGVVADHAIRLEHPHALLAPAPVAVQGPQLIERSLNWSPYQTASVAAARIVVVNDVADYA